MPSKIEKRGEGKYRLTVGAGYDGDGKQAFHRKTVTAANLTDARKQYALFVAEIERGQVATSGKMTLRDFFSYWKSHYAENNLAPKTVYDYDRLFVRIGHAIGHKRVDQIEPRHLLSFFKNLSEVGVRQDPNASRRKQTTPAPTMDKPLSPATQLKYYACLHGLFEKAVKWGFAPYNPVDKVEPPKMRRTQKAIYDNDETTLFLSALDGASLKHRVMALLALSLGTRKGELFGLQWKHINLASGTVSIEQNLQYLSGQGLRLGPPKTETSVRKITIPSSVLPIVSQYRSEQAAQRLKLGSKWEGIGTLDDDFIFTAWNGKPNYPDTFNTWLKRFTAQQGFKHITPQIFRHMAATFLLVAGVDLRTVSGKLGHSSTAVTGNIYAHLLQTAEQATAETMDAILQQNTANNKKKQTTS